MLSKVCNMVRTSSVMRFAVSNKMPTSKKEQRTWFQEVGCSELLSTGPADYSPLRVSLPSNQNPQCGHEKVVNEFAMKYKMLAGI
jgi:hypothetical protein